MNYRIQVVKAGEVIATETCDEHPSEDYLRSLARSLQADFCDVSRLEEYEVTL